MKYRFLSQQSCYQGFFSVDRHTVEHDCFEGPPQRVVRENMERGDAVAVVLYDEANDAVLLIEQFRIGPAVRQDNPWLIEIVAGMVEAGEDIEATARRECIEEAGYAADNLQYLGQYYVSPGGTSERITLYLAHVNQHQPVGEGGGVADEHEDIRRFWCPRSTAMQWVAEGKVNSGAPMLALLLAFGTGVSS